MANVNKLMTLPICALLVLGLNGCIVSFHEDQDDDSWSLDTENWERRQQRNQAYISQLDIGARLDAVTSELGTPDMTESFVRGGQTFRVLFYRTRLVHRDRRVTHDETTPLVFADGGLVGWGESAIENAMP